MTDTARPPAALVEKVEQFRGSDMHDLCDAADHAITDGGGFGWLAPPQRDVMERYWRGVLAVPGRSLFVARLEGLIVGSAQLMRPPPNNEAGAFAATLSTFFIAPWARGHGLARQLIQSVEDEAREDGYEVLQLDVRETQYAALQLYRRMGFVQWGANPIYAKVDGRFLTGYYFYKMLDEGRDLPPGPADIPTPPADGALK